MFWIWLGRAMMVLSTLGLGVATAQLQRGGGAVGMAGKDTVQWIMIGISLGPASRRYDFYRWAHTRWAIVRDDGLGRRPYLELELGTHRARALITRLRQNGLLDDAAYAESKARSGIVGKARSRRRMEQDLAQRGVSREVVSQAISRVFAEEGTSELAVAERAARKKLRSLDRHEPQVKKQKLYAFLARQGYPGEVVRKVMKRVLDTTVDEEPA